MYSRVSYNKFCIHSNAMTPPHLMAILIYHEDGRIAMSTTQNYVNVILKGLIMKAYMEISLQYALKKVSLFSRKYYGVLCGVRETPITLKCVGSKDLTCVLLPCFSFISNIIFLSSVSNFPGSVGLIQCSYLFNIFVQFE